MITIVNRQIINFQVDLKINYSIIKDGSFDHFTHGSFVKDGSFLRDGSFDRISIIYEYIILSSKITI